MSYGKLAVTAAAALLGAADARAAGTALRRAFWARPQALGEAFTAAAGGVSSLGINPAGLGGLKRPEILMGHSRGLTDDQWSAMGYAQPVRAAVVAASLFYYDAGDILVNLSSGLRETRSAQRDLVWSGAAAAPIGKSLTVGGGAKVFRSDLAGEKLATGWAFDAGALWRSPLRGLSLGGAVLNMGPEVTFEEASDPLPRTLRAGASFGRSFSEFEWAAGDLYDSLRLSAAFDAVLTLGEPAAYGAGVEGDLELAEGRFAMLRLGRIFNRDPDGFTLGLGFAAGRFTLDYALGLVRVFDNAHHVTLGWRF